MARLAEGDVLGTLLDWTTVTLITDDSTKILTCLFEYRVIFTHKTFNLTPIITMGHGNIQ